MRTTNPLGVNVEFQWLDDDVWQAEALIAGRVFWGRAATPRQALRMLLNTYGSTELDDSVTCEWVKAASGGAVH